MTKTKRSFIIHAALGALLTIHPITAATPKPASFHVEVTGHGKPMILIPGFASSGKTWDSTVAHFKDQYECHVLTLAGFAGEPRIEAPFLETVRKDLAAYIRENKMNKPVIVGHSLGGTLALWLAEQEPDLVGPLVIVDSLPFLAAVMNPKNTAESVKAQAEQMRKMYSGPATDQTEKMGEMAVKAMVTSPADFEMVMAWSRKSDRVAMGNAMYDMMTTDLRGDLDKITSPTLVLGTWIAYKQYATRDEVEKNFRTQYAKLKSYDFVLSDKARHFVMLDDPDGFFQALDHFLGERERPRGSLPGSEN
ncbi:MAG: alpha/beta hydrolase [Bryobacteraceae bacterium]|jgi:pimeloyl-ACP methyl ester carboxylesterase